MKLTNRLVFFLILIVSVVLRTIQYAKVKFTHDEFSALSRLHFTNLSDLIEYGVKVDGHPAGVHVLLYYWAKCFGYSEMSLKFSFLIMGILAVVLTYEIGRRWFNQTVGLYSMAFVASIQFTIAYSVIARPYISGLFTCLLTVFFLTKLIQHPSKNFWRNGLLMSVSIALCAYNHHFSLLFAAIVGITGLILIDKQFRLRYLSLGLIAIVLYLPALPVFFHQLSMGGVEQWLSKPDYTFLGNFLFYLMNCSGYMLILLALLLIWAIGFKKIQSINWKTYAVFFCWFIIPFFIGYYYSIYRLAVLQYSVLIFNFTFIIFLVFGYLKELTPRQNLIWVLLILMVNIYTLVFIRKHYAFYHRSIYQELLVDKEEANKKYEHITSLIFSHERITQHYLKQDKYSSAFQWDNFSSIGELKGYLQQQVEKSDYLFFGAISQVNPTHIPIIQLYYPYLIEEKNYFDGSTYVFSKNAVQSLAAKQFIKTNTFDEISLKEWENCEKSSIVIDSINGGNNYRMNRAQEWGPKISIALSQMRLDPNDFIDVTIKARSLSQDTMEAQMIMEIRHGDSLYVWVGAAVNEQLIGTHTEMQWNTFVSSVKLSDAKYPKGSTFTFYIWNKGKQLLELDDITIQQRKGNNLLYGIVEPLY